MKIHKTCSKMKILTASRNTAGLLAGAILLFTGSFAVHAQSMLNWDPGSTGGSGGPGPWNLTTANWFNGTVDVLWADSTPFGTNTAVFGGTAATVTVNTSLSVSNLDFNSAGYTISGSGNLTLDGGLDAANLSSGTTTISVPLTLPGGQQLWQAGSGGTLAVNSTLTRNAGAAVDFSSTGVTSSSLTDVNGVIGAWATVGAANSTAGDWAAISGGAISIYSGYTDISSTASTSQSGAGASTQNWFTGDPADANNYVTTLTTSATINSLVQQGDFGLNNGVTLTLGNGGLILRGVSRWMLGGTSSYLTSGNSTGELFVHAPDPSSGLNWTLWPIIEDNGSTPVILVKDGVDMVKLGNMSTYTGGTIINAGILASTCNALYGNGNAPTGLITPFGAGSITVQNGAELEVGNEPGNAFGEYDYNNNITANNGVIYEADAFQHIKGTLSVGAGGVTLGSTYDNKGDALLNGYSKGLFIDGLVTGSGPITVQDSGIDSVNAWDSSTVYFTSMGTAAQNTYSGTVTVNSWANHGGSYLYLIGTNALANATINLNGDNNASSGRFGEPALLFGSGTNLDGAGFATIGGLEGTGDFALADILTSQSGSSTGGPFALTVGNNNSSTAYSGVMSGAGSLTKIGTGTLTLSSAETYTGNTTVNGGTLALTGGMVNSTNITVSANATLDISTLSSVILGSSQALRSSGTVNGSLGTSSGSQIYADNGSGYGTNTITGSLTLASSALAYFNVGTSATGANDLISVGGTLTANNNIIHIKAPSTSSSLQQADYTLFTSPSAVSGAFASAPSWDVAPVNAANFSIVTSGNTVKLHYTATTGPTGAGTAAPATAVRNQNVLVTVNATNGSAGTVNSVVLNASAIGGSSSIALVSAGGNVWTNTVAVPAATSPGNYTLAATLTDTASLSGNVNIPLTVVSGNDVWNGAAANENFSSNLNWVNQTAPGLVGDSLEFAGAIGLTPNMDNSYTVTSVTFDASAGSFDISSADSSVLTLTGSGPLVVNSANPQTLSLPIADSGGGITKSGNGMLTLAGANTYTGPTVVNAGALDIAGSSASTANISVGNAAGDALLDVSGAGSISPYYLLLGNVTNSVAALYQTGGTINASANSGFDDLSVGNIAGSYGYFDASGGTATINGVAVAGEDNAGGGSNFNGPAGNGLFEVNGGTVNCTGWFVVARNTTAQTGVVNVYSGTLTYAGGGFINNWGSGQTTVINVLGGSLATSADNEIGFLGGTGIVNLLGGVTSVYAINGAWTGVANGQVSFNGGTLQASDANNNFLAVTSASIFGGGATVDNNGNAITIAQPLLAPAGNGIYGATISSAGAGYIAPPIVKIVNGSGDTTGYGATAIAQINPATGTLTNILITCPGFNYTATPTFTLTGGGATTPAVITGVAPVANTSGGLTSIGSSTLTLSAVNTYSGATVINAGTLSLTGSINNSTNIITGPGAIFDVSSITFTLGANQALSGWGTVNGAVNTSAGSEIYGGWDGTYGTNTLDSSLTLAAGAACYLDVGPSATGNNDQIVVDGGLTANGNVIHLKAPNTSGNLDTSDYVLINSPGGITGSFSTAPVWDVAPANAGHYSIVTGGTTVTLHYSATAASPTVTASANPATLLRNQTTVITANVTPGSASINTVTVDLSAVGGSTVALVQSNSSSLYTNTITVPAAASPGSATLTVTATDTASQSGSAGVPVTVIASTEVWDGGGGSNENWSTNLNWVSTFAPGLAGDTLVFAGTSGLAPIMNGNYAVAGITFSNNAGAFDISSSDNGTLTLNGPIINNSTNSQTFNVPVADSGGGVNVSAVGPVTLAGNNTYTGPTTVEKGTLNLTQSAASTANFNVGGAVGNSVLNLSGSASISPNYMLLGNVSGSAAAVYQTGGAVNAAVATGFDNLSVGNVTGSYGYYGADGGSFSVSGICLGGENNGGSGANFDATGGNGILEVNGGTVTDSGWLVIARQNGGILGPSTGVLNVYAGSLTYAGGGIVGPWDTNENAVINILGGSVANTASVGVYLGNSSYSGTLNLNGGLLEASLVTGYNGQSYSPITGGRLNFNGGTLQASAASGNFIAVNAANIYSGGATIDNNGYAVAIAQPLLAPAGKGVHGYQLASGGAGYIAPPIITITNGAGDTTGSGATAIAQINPATGTVTNVIITCAGVNYTATPVFLLNGGGASTAAVVNGVAPTPNSSGGFTAVGSGVTTLSGPNTYGGSTVISNGTLAVDSAASITNSPDINVTANGTLDVSAISFTLPPSETLLGNGAINGNLASSGTILAGSATSIGTLTFNNNLTLQSGGVTVVKLNESQSENDQFYCYGTMTYGGTLMVTNQAGTLQVGDNFQVFWTGGTSGNFASIVGSPGPGLAYSFNTNSGVLSVVVAPASISYLKFIGAPEISGTSLSFSATNSGAGSVYLLTTTNLTTPIAAWTPIWTNVFSGSGTFTTNLANTVIEGSKQQFFMLGNTNR